MISNKPKVYLTEISPAKAREFLEKNVNNFRKAQPETIRRYAKQMRNNQWEVNGESIKFDNNGLLIDGQHRLLAIVEADTTVSSFIIEGVANASNLDCGMRRSMGEFLAFNGIKSARSIGSIVSLYAHIRSSIDGSQRGTYVISSRIEMLNFVMTNIDSLYRFFKDGTNMHNYISNTRFASCMFMVNQFFPVKVCEFIHALNNLHDLYPTHPCVLLNRLISSKKCNPGAIVSRDWETALILKAFIAFRDGKNIERLTFVSVGIHKEKFPNPFTEKQFKELL